MTALVASEAALADAVGLMGEAILARHVAARSGQQADLDASGKALVLATWAAIAAVIASQGCLS